MDMYIELLIVIKTKHGSSKSHVLKLLSNFYGQKQPGHVRNQYLINKLVSVGFMQLLIDECIFYHDDIIFIVYVDDAFFLGPSDCKLTVMIKVLKSSGLKVEDQGHTLYYIGSTLRSILPVFLNSFTGIH